MKARDDLKKKKKSQQSTTLNKVRVNIIQCKKLSRNPSLIFQKPKCSGTQRESQGDGTGMEMARQQGGGDQEQESHAMSQGKSPLKRKLGDDQEDSRQSTEQD